MNENCKSQEKRRLFRLVEIMVFVFYVEDYDKSYSAEVKVYRTLFVRG